LYLIYKINDYENLFYLELINRNIGGLNHTMRRKFNRSLLKSVERAKKLKDLEIAKSLEINLQNNELPPNKKRTPKVRSDLPKE